MRLLSQVFQPLITIPKNGIIKSTEITCKSQKLLMECGLIRPTSSGFFAILPLARRSLDKIEAKFNKAMSSLNAQRISLPALTRSELWKKSGRLAEYQELMSVTDRHNKRFLLSPTFEESIAELMADVGPISYKQLPLLLYQISNKYRDEHRPKHGLLRAREFIMLDLYGVHASPACAETAYSKVCEAYRSAFQELGLEVFKVSAPVGDMGGTVSHEWHLPAARGEDTLNTCNKCGHVTLAGEGGEKCGSCGGVGTVVNSVEVAHTFILGTKYSEALGADFIPASGQPAPLYMSCYGVGISRLLAASMEGVSGDSIRWPEGAAPYSVLIIGPKEGSKEWSSHGVEAISEVYSRVSSLGSLKDDVLLDDRHSMTIGKRLVMAEKMGYPNVIVCGRGTLNSTPQYELYTLSRNQEKPDAPKLMTLEEILLFLSRGREVVGEENKVASL